MLTVTRCTSGCETDRSMRAGWASNELAKAKRKKKKKDAAQKRLARHVQLLEGVNDTTEVKLTNGDAIDTLVEQYVPLQISLHVSPRSHYKLRTRSLGVLEVKRNVMLMGMMWCKQVNGWERLRLPPSS